MKPNDTGYVMEMYRPEMTGTGFHLGMLTGIRQ